MSSYSWGNWNIFSFINFNCHPQSAENQSAENTSSTRTENVMNDSKKKSLMQSLGMVLVENAGDEYAPRNIVSANDDCWNNMAEKNPRLYPYIYKLDLEDDEIGVFVAILTTDETVEDAAEILKNHVIKYNDKLCVDPSAQVPIALVTLGVSMDKNTDDDSLKSLCPISRVANAGFTINQHKVIQDSFNPSSQNISTKQGMNTKPINSSLWCNPSSCSESEPQSIPI